MEPSVWSSAPNLSSPFSPSEANHVLPTNSHMLSFCSVLGLANDGRASFLHSTDVLLISAVTTEPRSRHMPHASAVQKEDYCTEYPAGRKVRKRSAKEVVAEGHCGLDTNGQYSYRD
ncbi:hypothetical protein Baya_8067 [Bagarius yarrelli]|uniref:Uncharacterized protein n=1 Tax=Bagarius yarrelli TaxID=175774 RepID=A0A556U472_BAGYA|nr:hypothetical protein Baya_8067 [Bagarius yarrelli]